MPTYDYKCKACGHAFEEFQSMTAPLLKKCPSCGKNKLERLIGTGAALMFKGSGFYTTDYRSDSYKKAAEADKGGKPDTGKSETSPKPEPAKAEGKGDGAKAESAPAKSETKTEPKSEPKPKAKKNSKSET